MKSTDYRKLPTTEGVIAIIEKVTNKRRVVCRLFALDNTFLLRNISSLKQVIPHHACDNDTFVEKHYFILMREKFIDNHGKLAHTFCFRENNYKNS